MVTGIRWLGNVEESKIDERDMVAFEETGERRGESNGGVFLFC